MDPSKFTTIDYTKMTPDEVREFCGDDAGKWSAAFAQVMEAHRPARDNKPPPWADRDYLQRAWFANMIGAAVR